MKAWTRASRKAEKREAILLAWFVFMFELISCELVVNQKDCECVA